MEISNYWKQLYLDSAISIKKEGLSFPLTFWNDNLLKFKAIWIINYSLLFLSILSFVNIKKIKDKNLAFISLGLNAIAVVFFLTRGLYVLSELRDSYLNQSLDKYYPSSPFYIAIKYISFAFVGLTLISTYMYLNREFMKPVSLHLKIAFDFLLYTTILWIASSELISWVDLIKSQQSYKLGLSVLWGVYALLIVILGIWKRKKHLRVGAFVLFAVTLLKLFFYDISHLDNLPKTIIFVSLGILLLIISFLYNKYKHLISGENEE
jgi:hypothetical protein